MKANTETRKFNLRLIQLYGKKNGKVRSVYYDCPEMERKSFTNKIIKVQNDKSWKKEIEVS